MGNSPQYRPEAREHRRGAPRANPAAVHRVDPYRLAAELVRALRGRRSRPAFSRHIGYQSNVVQRWETQQSWPTAQRFFRVCERMGVDPDNLVQSFLRQRPKWLDAAPLTSAQGVVAFLNALRGKNSIAELAKHAGYSRTRVSRWLSGSAEPKLPEFLGLVEACSRRLVDFAVQMAPPERLPSIRDRFDSLTLSRQLAYSHPISHAVLRALELEGYVKGKSGGMTDSAYLAERLGASEAAIGEALSLLEKSGQIRRARGRWIPRSTVVETGTDPDRARELRLHWIREALRRLDSSGPGRFGYSLFAVSRKDLQRLAEIQTAYIREMQAVIAASEPSECVGLYCTQLLDLADAHDNAFARPSRNEQQKS